MKGAYNYLAGDWEPARSLTRGAIVLVLVMMTISGIKAAENVPMPGTRDHWFVYTNAVIPEVPWSIHIAKIERGHPELRFCTTLGHGDRLGMATVSEQLKLLPSDLGQPLVAINGDFYEKGEVHEGDPRDLQIRLGEIISSPAGHTCFWIDQPGNPQMTNVYSHFRVVWPTGRSTPLGLNQDRADDAAVLYTTVSGASTRTTGGVELGLERASTNTWLPFRPGQSYEATVSSVRESGDTPLERERPVLSLGPKLISQLPRVKAGALLKLVFQTEPDLSGVEMAIGGGPALVRDGKVEDWKGILHIRHPRSALGWNKTHFFLVEIDGRQSDLSVGMTFPELAAFLVKLGCDDAMNLDGGGSATLWTLGTVRNSPSEGQERPAPNALVLLKTRRPQGASDP